MPYNEDFFGRGHTFDLVVTQAGLDVAARYETEQLKPYKDAHRTGFKWAIGYGHVEGGDVEPKIITPDMKITSEEAWAILRADMEDNAQWLRKRITSRPNTCMFNALVSLTLNAGKGNIGGVPKKNIPVSRVLTALNAERYVEAGAAFIDHRYAWFPVLDPFTKKPMLSDSGKVITERKEVNGLTLRRGLEMALYQTKIG